MGSAFSDEQRWLNYARYAAAVTAPTGCRAPDRRGTPWLRQTCRVCLPGQPPTPAANGLGASSEANFCHCAEQTRGVSACLQFAARSREHATLRAPVSASSPEIGARGASRSDARRLARASLPAASFASSPCAESSRKTSRIACWPARPHAASWLRFCPTSGASANHRYWPARPCAAPWLRFCPARGASANHRLRADRARAMPCRQGQRLTLGWGPLATYQSPPF